jgi:cysteine-rich repeat protein
MPRSTPRRTRRHPRALWAFTLLALLRTATSAAATYTVAASGGDFLSIQAALNVAVAGDAVLVREKPTPYFEKLVFPASGDAGDGYITLQAAPGEHPVLDGTGVPGADMVRIDSRSYVKLIGFEIQNDLGVDDGSGVRVLGAGSHIEIRDNRIHDIRGHDAMGITVYGTAASPISDLVIDGNEIYDCEPAPSEALTLNGNVTDFQVTGNDVHDVDNIGIDFIGGETDIQPDPAKVARNGVCRGNRVTRARASYGGGFAGGIYVDGGADITIENNLVTESDLGLEVGAENRAIVTTGIIVRDNVLIANDKAGLVFGGFASSVGRVRNCAFLNNTLYHNDTLGIGFGELWIQYAEDNVVRNNVIVATAQGRLVTSDDGNVGTLLDYNLWFTPGGASAAEFMWNGTLYAGFAAYRAATGEDASSLFTDPLLVAPDAGDVHLFAGSPAINAGDPAFMPGVGEVDLDGAPRVNGPRVDVGADEATICGNDVVEPGEMCDDGNLVDGDGCDSNCTLTACGNGIVTAGEDCDDGNVASGDCCAPDCRFDPPGAACDDGNPCTAPDTCSAGVCAGTAAPAPTCRAALAGSVVVKRGTTSSRDLLTWKWAKGDATTLADFGDPVGGATDYTLCLYDATAGTPSLRLRAEIPGGGTCHRKPCWKSSGTSVLHYADRELTPSGVLGALLKAGAQGLASLRVKAKGTNLAPPSLPFAQDPAVTVQLRSSDGRCWGSAFTAPASRNDAVQFKDKRD